MVLHVYIGLYVYICIYRWMYRCVCIFMCVYIHLLAVLAFQFDCITPIPDQKQLKKAILAHQCLILLSKHSESNSIGIRFFYIESNSECTEGVCYFTYLSQRLVQCILCRNTNHHPYIVYFQVQVWYIGSAYHWGMPTLFHFKLRSLFRADGARVSLVYMCRWEWLGRR